MKTHFIEKLTDFTGLFRSSAKVTALTYCDLHKIMHDDVIEVLKMFPEHAREFWENLHLTYDLRETSRIFKESERSDYSSECENSETTRNDFNLILF